MLEFLSVAKRITLYLARISPQQTIDGLVQELRRQLHEEEPGGSGLLGSAPHSEGPVGSDFRTLLQQAAAGECVRRCWIVSLYVQKART
jgi:hypothetical protein